MPRTTRCAGFRFGAASAGIKPSGALDVGVVIADKPASCAAVFTQNHVKAAPVLISQAAFKKNHGKVRAIVVNSGNANACTGTRGMADARAMATQVAKAVGTHREAVLVASTGVIGMPMPMDMVRDGIDTAVTTTTGFEAFADSTLTTDRARKVARTSVKSATFIGCTKGAGMIAPNMATTLSFVVTDGGATPAALRRALTRATAETFNAITVDGDTSTNDMIAVIASGAAGITLSPNQLYDGLFPLLNNLAHKLMRGGEGVHHVVTVRVSSARSAQGARQVARTVANSPLVKTAIAGADPNWGRFVCAAGNAGISFDPRRVSVQLDNVPLVRAGTSLMTDAVQRRAKRVMAKPTYTLTIDLGGGRAQAQYLACDLSHDYVSINADYRS